MTIDLWCPLCRDEIEPITITRCEDDCTDQLVVSYRFECECDACDLIQVIIELPEATVGEAFDPR